MDPSGKSRWADTNEDIALEARRRQEREEKRQRKAAEQARRLQQAPRVLSALWAATDATPSDDGADDDSERPAKRRRFTPDREAATAEHVQPRRGQAQASSVPEAPTPIPSSSPLQPQPQQSGHGFRSNSILLRLPPPRFGPSRCIDDYDKLNDIDEGTYGTVARGRHLATGKVVAIKKLKQFPHDGVPVTGLREIQILRDCKHPNIVKLVEVVVGNERTKPDNGIYLVLEFIEHDLKSVLDEMPEAFMPSEVKRLLLQLASGLEYLHDRWIVHRDLKTSNLLLNNRGQLKIADFGMARYMPNPPPSQLTSLVVTLWYRAPELLMGTRTYGPAIDMWSVGCVFAELLTREALLKGVSEADQLAKSFALCGLPTEETWPGFRQLPHARRVRLPAKPPAAKTRSHIRTRFPVLTEAGCALLCSLLTLNPARRPTASEMLGHEYFQQDPKPKKEFMFPTFPSKAGQERRRRQEPHAPARGQTAKLGDLDFSGIFQGREREERGSGLSLRMA